MHKRILSLLLAVFLIFGLFAASFAVGSSLTAQAETVEQDETRVTVLSLEGHPVLDTQHTMADGETAALADLLTAREEPSMDDLLALASLFTGSAYRDDANNTHGKLYPSEEAEEEPVVIPDPLFRVDGHPVYEAEMAEINGVTYVSVEDFLRPALNSRLALARVTTGSRSLKVLAFTYSGETLSLTANSGKCYFVANGRYLYLKDGLVIQNDEAMLPLDSLVYLFDGSVTYTESGVPLITLSEELLTCGDDFYSATDVSLIARTVAREAGNQSFTGKLALANLIMNRVRSSRFPNSVYGVLYQRNQFTVVNTDAWKNCTPSSDCVIAAKLALEGVSITSGTYYNVTGMTSWASQNRTYVGTIGNHDFYK